MILIRQISPSRFFCDNTISLFLLFLAAISTSFVRRPSDISTKMNWLITEPSRFTEKPKKINGGFFQIKSHFSLSVQFLSVTFLKKKKYFDSISVKIFQKIEENIEEEIRFFRAAMFIFKTVAFRSVSRLTISWIFFRASALVLKLNCFLALKIASSYA